METMRILDFRVVEKGQYCCIIWPWETPEAFLYEAFVYGCTYKIRQGVHRKAADWIEIVSAAGDIHGEYSTGLHYGLLRDHGWRLYRRFNAQGSHYLAQHGLDGIPRVLWDAAYEVDPGVPMGKVQFQFRIATKRGAFDLTFYDWLRYFVSGRNGHISEMGITVTKSKK
jgi:hypothetical protein